MPYVHLNVARKLTEEQIQKTRETIASFMPIIPGKTRENTMIHIEESCRIFKGDSDECMFLEARLYKPAPLENKTEFVQKVTAALCEMFDIAPERLYINIIEMNEWGSGGRYF